MVKKFAFSNAAPLEAFIEAHRDYILGKPIRSFYASNVFGSFSDQPLVFEFDEFVLVVSYFFYSDLEICLIDPALFHSDESLNFLYWDVPRSRNVRHCIWEEDFPYIDYKIVDITIERFSGEFEINASTRESRPAGGDYFGTITVHLEDGERFFICAQDAMSDGYVDIWD